MQCQTPGSHSAGRAGPRQPVRHAAAETSPAGTRMSGADPSRGTVPSFNPCVLITRPEPGASETAARVALLGFVPIIAPAIRIHPTPARAPAAAALAAVLVTSGNAVDALPQAYHDTCLFAVGDATAERARKAGFKQVLSAGGDAASLAELVIRRQNPKNGTLLLASGRGQGGALAESLRQAGYRVVRRVFYEALPAWDLPPAAAAALRQGRVHAALFFSAETARQFVRLARRIGLADTLTAVEAVSIGRPAAVALEALPWRSIRVAARPTQDEMLALLQ
jgi:uroporphyrinogen-III synthase